MDWLMNKQENEGMETDSAQAATESSAVVVAASYKCNE